MNRNRLLAVIVVTITIAVTKAQDTIDLWNLPPLSIEQGRYTTDWDNLSRQYNTPAWWREAKLGAWSHWDPQSMAEDGDWYSRGMYMEGHPQSKFHREHFGHPSEYGYKELCRDWKTDLWDPEDLMQLYQKMGARRRYRGAEEIITRLMQNVSRNGCLLLNITQHGRGNIDDEARKICLDIGRWIDINKEAIYSARPFTQWGNEDIIYTRQGGNIYATILHTSSDPVVLPALSSHSSSVGKISKVELVENGRAVPFTQSTDGLTLQMGEPSRSEGIQDTKLAMGYKVVRISHDKAWFNDDDPGVRTFGWDRRCNPHEGDYNNDLSFSNQAGGCHRCHHHSMT